MTVVQKEEEGECAVIAPRRQLTIFMFYWHQKRKSLDVRPLRGKYVNFVSRSTSQSQNPATHPPLPLPLLRRVTPPLFVSPWGPGMCLGWPGLQCLLRFSALSEMQLNFWRMENFPITHANSQGGSWWPLTLDWTCSPLHLPRRYTGRQQV